MGFNPRAPRGARPGRCLGLSVPLKFQSTRPAWGATSNRPHTGCVKNVSIHAPRVGRDAIVARSLAEHPVFQSTRPAWGATAQAFAGNDLPEFQSTRPAWGATIERVLKMGVSFSFNPRAPRGARRTTQARKNLVGYVSIHAPRVGRDVSQAASCRGGCGFNPRAPRGARREPILEEVREDEFQSTRPAWGATNQFDNYPATPEFQSTRPAWGATRAGLRSGRQQAVSIHAPRVGRDSMRFLQPRCWHCFNPRAPRGARRMLRLNQLGQKTVSIHAPRVGRDRRASHRSQRIRPFQSTRPAWGATAVSTSMRGASKVFQSTRPAWGATVATAVPAPSQTVSIHAPRVGRDGSTVTAFVSVF